MDCGNVTFFPFPIDGMSRVVLSIGKLSLPRFVIQVTLDHGGFLCLLYLVVIDDCLLCFPVVPTITEVQPESGWTEVAEDDTLQLTCRATGRPEPVITWSHRRHQFDAEVSNGYQSIDQLRHRSRCH